LNSFYIKIEQSLSFLFSYLSLSIYWHLLLYNISLINA
jgi:hypothetical protein